MAFFAASNRASLRMLAEASNGWGITPGSGNPREVRFTSSSLAMSKETKVSEEIRADRMVPAIVETGAKTEGDVNGEFSAGAYDDLYAGFVYGSWTRPMTFDRFFGPIVSITADNVVSIAGENVVPYYTVGRYVKLEGFLNNVNNIYAAISAVAWNAGANRTDVTLSIATLVVEGGSYFTQVMDANDVIILDNQAMRLGTAGAPTIDSNGTNAFADAIAAGQLSIGQKIFIEGLGFDTGAVSFTANPVDNTTLVIGDGTNFQTFRFGGIPQSGESAIVIGANAAATCTAFAAALRSTYVQGDINVTVTGVASPAVTFKNFNGVGGSIVCSDGVNVAITAFAGGHVGARGVFTITFVTSDVLGLNPAPPTVVATGTNVTIKGSMLRNPYLTQDFVAQSWTFEQGFEDVSQYFLFKGMTVDSISLEVAAGAINKVMTKFKGGETQRISSNTSLLLNAPYVPLQAVTYEPTNATVNVGMLTEDGVPLTTAIKSIKLDGSANLREQTAIGNKYPVGIGTGRFNLKGTIEAYFEDGQLYDQFNNHDTVSLSFPITDADGNHYEFTVPSLVFTSDPIGAKGIDQDVMETIAWEAQRDPTTQCMLQIDRFSSLNAPTA